jgi:DNA primase
MFDLTVLLERLGIQVTNRAGRRLWARCPSREHDDRDPSWCIINDPGGEKNSRHHCYGCGFGGWPVHLVQEVLDCDRSEARAWLAGEGIDVPTLEVNLEVEHREPRGRHRVELPPETVMAAFDVWPAPARRYLERRGFGAATVRKWRLGYAVDGLYAFRIIIPARNEHGELESYTGRSFVDAEPRYYNPTVMGPAMVGPEHWPRRQLRNRIVVCEGPFDALAIDRIGMPTAALLGSNPHPLQLVRLSTFQDVLIATDPDSAGAKAAAELEGSLARWVSKVRRVLLPRGQDPASMPCAELKALLE